MATENGWGQTEDLGIKEQEQRSRGEIRERSGAQSCIHGPGAVDVWVWIPVRLSIVSGVVRWRESLFTCTSCLFEGRLSVISGCIRMHWRRESNVGLRNE